MKKIFIDTGAVYALIDRDDPYHLSACKCWSEILQGENNFIFTNYIISETYTLLRYRLNYEAAREFLRRLEESVQKGRTKIIDHQENLAKHALQILEQYSEQDLSYTDAVSMAVIKDLRIPRVFSYDRHFNLTQAKILPGRGH